MTEPGRSLKQLADDLDIMESAFATLSEEDGDLADEMAGKAAYWSDALTNDVTDEDFVDHVWIEDTDGPVCTECGLTLETFKKEKE